MNKILPLRFAQGQDDMDLNVSSGPNHTIEKPPMGEFLVEWHNLKSRKINMHKQMQTVLCALLGMGMAVSAAWGKGTSDVLPSDLSVGIYARLRSSAPGIQWVLDSYKKNFLLKHLGEDSQTVVEDFSLVKIDEVSVALMNPLEEKPKMLIVGDMIPTDASIKFKVKKINFNLKIKERSEEKGLQSAVVKALLGAWVSGADRVFLPTGGGTNDLAYSAALEKEGEVCAYTVHNKRVIVGNALSLVQTALRLSESNAAVSAAPDLGEFLRRFQKPHDILMYVNNHSGFLSRFNAQMEKKLQIPILMNVSSIRSAGIFVDIVSQDRINLRGTFLVDNPKALAETKQDLSFLAEFLRRKMLSEGIRSVAHLREAPGMIQVRMSLYGTSAFLTKFLEKGSIEKTL